MSGKGDVNFSGKWELTSTDNYPEWLVAMGIPEADRQKYLATAPSLEVIHDGDTFKYVARKNDSVKTMTTHIGKEYLDTAHGMKEMRVARWNGDQLVITASNNPPGRWTTTCELNGNKLLMSYISHQEGHDNVTAKRWFSKVGDPDLNM